MTTVKISQQEYDTLKHNTSAAISLSKQNSELKQINESFSLKLAELEDKIKELTEQLVQKTTKDGTTTNNVVYSTDEEDLENETNPSNRQSNKRRRKSAAETSSKGKEKEKKTPNPPLPPPINVSNVNNYKQFREFTLAVAASAKFKATSANDMKITVQNEDEYRKLKNLLEVESSEGGKFPELVYHTYQLKTEKNFRVVIRGLPHTCESQEITVELKELGHEPIKVLNIFKKIKNHEGKKIIKNFPLFMLELNQKENNKEIFDLKYLLHCKISVEAPRQVKTIPQCLNCQQLGHTKNFCKRQSVCVKCAGKHSSVACTKKPNVTPKCALCQNEGHTANYKGCPVYQKKSKVNKLKL